MNKVTKKVNRGDREGKEAMHRLLEERKEKRSRGLKFADMLDREKIKRVRRKVFPRGKTPWQENDS